MEDDSQLISQYYYSIKPVTTNNTKAPEAANIA
jgi:hypothetical protein